jgi:WD40 repeat protein/serine/threonine protein kinase
LIDHFRIKRLLGQGGMSVVYLARDLKLGRQVALKLIHPRDMETWEAVPRFLQEARATAQFSHPHIVTIYTVGEYEGSPYLALEYLEGQTLRERLDERQFSLLEALRLLEAVADALTETHQHQVLHCDLKPENLQLARDGRLRVLDFGLSRFLHQPTTDDAPPEHWLSKVQGTAPYMAPEQWQQGARLTSATDSWAFGVLMFELLTGDVPFQELSLFELQRAIRHNPAPPLPEHLPPTLRTLVEECLSKKPDNRPSMDTCLQRIRAFRQPQMQEGETELNPFRGLSAYREEHASFFFGRESEIELCLERLREQPILGVVGPSGCGKSSFLLAGAVPRLLEQESWLVLKLRPHRRPFLRLASQLLKALEGHSSVQPSLLQAQQTMLTEERLAEQLREQPRMLSVVLFRLAEHRRQHVLLVLDQLEELITQVESSILRQRFVSALAWAAEDPQDPVRVLFSLRDDYLGRFAESTEAQRFLSQVMILRIPDSAVLQEIVERPVRQLGYRYESEQLVQQMIQTVQGEVGGLPLLQFACRKMWEQRDRQQRLLQESVYHKIGGVGGALSEHAEGTLRQMTEPQQQATRSLLRRLVTAEGTRQLLSRTEALEGLGADGRTVCQQLIQARLLTVHQPQEPSAHTDGHIEVAHESLLTQWTTFRRWLEEDREEIAFLQELSQAAQLWQKRGHRQEETWSGPALQEALSFQKKQSTPLPSTIQQFLEASQLHQRRKQRFQQRLITLGLAVILLIVLGLSGGTVLLNQKNQQISHRWALSQQATALAAFERRDYLTARASLRAAFEKYDSPALRSLWMRLKQNSLVWKESLGAPLHDVQFQPKGPWLALATKFGVVLVHRITGRRLVLRGHRQRVLRVAFSPDGKWLASGSWDGEIRLWRQSRGAYRFSGKRVRASRVPVEALVFSPSGRRLLSAGYVGVSVHDLRSGKTQQLRIGPARCLAFDKKGRLLIGGYRPYLRVVNFKSGKAGRISTGRLSRQQKQWIRQLRQLAVSPNGDWLAGVGGGEHLLLWSLPSFQLQQRRAWNERRLLSVTFGANGGWLAAAGAGKTIWLWKGPHWKRWQSLRGHRGRVLRLASSKKGQGLASVGHDQSLHLWQVLPNRPPPSRNTTQGAITSLSFGPRGRLLATGGEDRTIRLWDLKSSTLQQTLQGHEGSIRYVRFSPDGEHLLSSSYDQSIRLWKMKTGRVHRVFLGFLPYLFRVPFDNEGNHLATVRGPFVYVWKVIRRARVFRLQADRLGRIDQVAFDPLGRTFATSGRDLRLRLWSLSTQKLLRTIPLPSRQIELVYSPDGNHLAASGSDHKIRLWSLNDSTTGQVVQQHRGFINRLLFDPFSRALFSASFDGTVRVYELGSRKAYPLQATNKAACRHFVHLSIDFRGEQIAASCADHRSWLWDWKKRTAPRVLRLQRGALTGLRFSPTQDRLAVSSNEGELRLWSTHPLRPAWRTTVYLPRSHRLLTHRGWTPSTPQTSRWKKQLERRAWKAVSDPKETFLAIQTSSRTLELWSMKKDRLLWKHHLPSLRRFRVLDTGEVLIWSRSLSNWKGTLRWLSPTGKVQREWKGISAWRWSESSLWLCDSTHLQQWVRAEKKAAFPLPLPTRPTRQQWVTAMTRSRGANWLLVYRSGELHQLRTDRTKVSSKSRQPAYQFPPEELTHIRELPGALLVAGFVSGVVGLWSRRTGKKLNALRLHGSIQGLHWDGKELLITSDLGDRLRWKLEVFQTPYCALLREMWKQIPASGKKTASSTRTASHRCYR